MDDSLLGTLTPERFLRTHWQRKPWFVKGALADVADAFDARSVRALACRDDVESRLVLRARGRWSVEHGPFTRRRLARLPARGWSLLVQGADMHLPAARELMNRFDFVPYARHDDVMLSLSPPGGGVGPHFDSYDVFLVQAHGRRRWRIGAQRDLRLLPDAPLRILQSFRPQREWSVEPGDLLYLPPQHAHEGTALTECITCSIGFRAPSRQELVTAFLQWLAETVALDGRYDDRTLTRQRHPAQISAAMLRQIDRLLQGAPWQRSAVERFTGEYLTEPKPHVWYRTPAAELTFEDFMRHARTCGIRLALKSRMLFSGDRFFINGDCVQASASARAALADLADTRAALPWKSRSVQAARKIYDWYRLGYVELA